MEKYYVQINTKNKKQEVHKADCFMMDPTINKLDLGHHYNGFSAMRKAKAVHENADGCSICVPGCHHA